MHNRWIISFNKSWIWLIVLFRRLSCKRNNTWIISFTIFCFWWSYWWSLMARKWHNTWIITFHEFRFGWCNRWSFIIWSSRSYNRWIVSFRIFWILVFCFILVRIAKLRRREESASSKTIIKAMTTIFYKAKKTVIESTVDGYMLHGHQSHWPFQRQYTTVGRDKQGLWRTRHFRWSIDFQLLAFVIRCCLFSLFVVEIIMRTPTNSFDQTWCSVKLRPAFVLWLMTLKNNDITVAAARWCSTQEILKRVAWYTAFLIVEALPY